MAKNKGFKPILIGLSDFANGTRFRIDQIKRGGACRITSVHDGKVSYSGSIPNAWKSVMFQADVDYHTQNTSRWRG